MHKGCECTMLVAKVVVLEKTVEIMLPSTPEEVGKNVTIAC
jgi:hypothetical protein